MEESQNASSKAFNAFETLGLATDLAIEDDLVESTWRQLSRELHPDSDAGDADRAAGVHRAQQVLRSPGQRLKHWLQLHQVEIPRQGAVAPDLMDWFSEVGTLIATADDVLKRRAAASSALARALLTESEITAQQALQSMLGRLQTERLAITQSFPAFQEAAASGNFSQALAAAGRLGFLEKWEAQVQERLMRLIAGDS